MHEVEKAISVMGKLVAGMYFIRTASGKIDTAGKEVRLLGEWNRRCGITRVTLASRSVILRSLTCESS